ncbi:MAG: DivIVA domain-containing protein [Bacilli bacterium]|nr:DivIVA domain-containing protein [Bacilli bacterium]
MDEKSSTPVGLTDRVILEKRFTPNVKGYDPDEVDYFLDQVIRDYQAYDKYVQDTQAYIQRLETELRKVKASSSDLEVKLASAETRLKGIKDTDKVDTTNISLLQRITRLENALYAKGIDPTKI